MTGTACGPLSALGKAGANCASGMTVFFADKHGLSLQAGAIWKARGVEDAAPYGRDGIES